MTQTLLRYSQDSGLLQLPDRHRLWTLTAIGFAVLTVAFAGLGAVDARTFNDVSTWAKPLKFALSLAVFYFTLAIFAPLLGQGYFLTTRGRMLTWVAILCGVFEIVYIALQAARGEASHFNVSTPFHGSMYSLMGVGATLLVGVCLWMGLRILRRHGTGDAYALAVGLGLVLTFVLGGGLGGYLSSQGSHWVGGSLSDAQNWPLFHWSRDGGDLRVAHFFGLHAMQILPLLALPFAGKARGSGTVWVVSCAVALTAFTLFTFLQAVQGQPFAG